MVNKEFYFLSLDSQSSVLSKLCLHIVGPMMILGLIVSSISGARCSTINVSSRVCEGWRFIMWFVNFPRCVVIIMYIEYRDVIKILIPNSTIE